MSGPLKLVFIIPSHFIITVIVILKVINFMVVIHLHISYGNSIRVQGHYHYCFPNYIKVVKAILFS